jgi:phosphoribosylanthranilate isomerase
MSVRIKICGITNRADAEQAAALGVDMVGLNFYPRSPRCIDAATAKAIVDILPATVEPVALVVNESPLEAQRIAGAIGTVQLHGDPPDHLLADRRWILAYPVRDASSLQQISVHLEHLRAAGDVPAAILVDAHVPGMHGGTGQTAPWHLLADFRPGVPLILAGGLTPDNVADAIRVVRPYAVDVASGVEARPGIKDRDKMRRFIDAVRLAEMS